MFKLKLEDMSPYTIALKVINTYLNKGIGAKFSLKEVSDEIIKQGGALRTSPLFLIKDYFNSLYGLGIIEYDYSASDTSYVVVASTISEAEKVVGEREKRIKDK